MTSGKYVVKEERIGDLAEPFTFVGFLSLVMLTLYLAYIPWFYEHLYIGIPIIAGLHATITVVLFKVLKKRILSQPMTALDWAKELELRVGRITEQIQQTSGEDRKRIFILVEEMLCLASELRELFATQEVYETIDQSREMIANAKASVASTSEGNELAFNPDANLARIGKRVEEATARAAKMVAQT